MSITTVGLDADDTLWHNETIFRRTHDRFGALPDGCGHPAPGPGARMLSVVPGRVGIPSIGVRMYRPVPPTRIGSWPFSWARSISLRAMVAQSAAEQASAPSRMPYSRCGARTMSAGEGAADRMGKSR